MLIEARQWSQPWPSPDYFSLSSLMRSHTAAGRRASRYLLRMNPATKDKNFIDGTFITRVCIPPVRRSQEES